MYEQVRNGTDDQSKDLSEIAIRIRSIRTDNGLTQAQFGRKLSVSQDTVSLWEKGKSVPTVEYIIAVCKLFAVSADYLLGLSDY